MLRGLRTPTLFHRPHWTPSRSANGDVGFVGELACCQKALSNFQVTRSILRLSLFDYEPVQAAGNTGKMRPRACDHAGSMFSE